MSDTAVQWSVHWLLVGGLLHFVQRGGAWAGQFPPRCTKCSSPQLYISSQCTNSVLFDVAL